jgi:hypothetical protein
MGEGVRGRGGTALLNAPNHIFVHMFCPPLNPRFHEDMLAGTITSPLAI